MVALISLYEVNGSLLEEEKKKRYPFSVSSVPDILLLAYQHSIPLSLSLPAQVHALHRHIECAGFRIGGNMRLGSLTFCRRCDRSGWFCTAWHI